MTTRRSRLRISLAVLAVFALVAVFVVRLVDIQVVRADELNSESEGKRGQTLVTYGLRGDIVDRDGTPLAVAVERFDVTADPEAAVGTLGLTEKVTADLQKIAEITGADPAVMAAALTADPASNFAYLVQGITLDQFDAVWDLGIPWVYFAPRHERVYPNGQTAGNLVGFIGTDGPQAGLELTEDACLAGVNGEMTYERGLDGVRIPGSEVVETAPKDGGTLRLTIDSDLQYSIQQRMAQGAQQLGATWATAAVMRVSDGALMAVTDWPTVDPNNVDAAPRTALGSLAFSTPYEPGSIMKPITAAMLMDAGVATPESRTVAPGRLYLSDGTFIKDSWAHDDLNLTLTGALVHSSNTATSEFSKLLDAESRRQYLLDFGFNDFTEVGFNGESEGWVLDLNQWDERTNYAVQFGQAIQVTTVQMASAYQTLANGGVRMPVHLVEGCEWPDGTVTETPAAEGVRVISEQAADDTVDMLEMVATQGSSADSLRIPGYRVAVKSGTADVAEGGVYVDKNVVSYAGMVPADDPQYVVVISFGLPYLQLSGVIAPTWRDVAAQVLTNYRIPPTDEPVRELPVFW
ncbi:MAG TPA: penicillin-binding protein 2 [Rhodoglobus sp.]|nr:penicillin-binding protein 2 [Rhodoglobus sp.]